MNSSEIVSRWPPVTNPANCPAPPGPAFREFPRTSIDDSVATCFERQVRAAPQSQAVKFGNQAWTYDDLNLAANRLAHAIVAASGERPAPVAFLAERGTAEITAIFGILKAAKFYCPLDPTFPPPRVAQVLSEVEPAALVTTNRYAPIARELAAGRFPVVNLDELDPTLPGENLNLPITADDYAYILFTSSSTGRAKGVLLDQRALLHHLMKVTNSIYLSPDDRFALLPSCTTAAATLGIFGSLLNGATVIPFDVRSWGVAPLADLIDSEKITIYHSVPTTFRALVETLGNRTFSSVRLVRLGGETIIRRDVEACRAHFGPHCIFNSTLGSTEITTLRQYFLDTNAPLPTSRVPVGYEIADTEILVLDDDGQPVGPNNLGEIVVKSRYVAVGYWKNPEQTSRVFRPDPAGSSDRLCFTGDLGIMRPDGCLEHHSRKDFLVKVRGHRIETEEIELALLELDAIKQAVVVARQDQPRKNQPTQDRQADPRLVAYLVPCQQSLPTVTALRSHLLQKLPHYMVPAAFVTLSTLPLTPSGKIDRLALPPPSTSRPLLESAYIKPSDPSQALIADIWETLLNIRPIGVIDSFFDLGGDSLLAVSLLTRLEETFSRAIPQANFMASPTIAGLAQSLLQLDQAKTQPPLVKLHDSADRTPLFFLHGDFNGGGYYAYNLARYLDPRQPLYLLHPHGLFTPSVPSSIEAMADSLLDIVLSARPAEPYALAGHCNGAVVALELARRLLTRGSYVESLILIAPPAILPQPIRDASGEHSNRLDGALGEVRRRLLFETYRARFNAFAPPPYPGRVTIFQPADSGPADICWRRLAANLEIHMIPGSHQSSITQHARQLAAQLNQCLLQPTVQR